MKVLLSFLLAIIALIFCFNASAQDVIYTISGEIDHQKTPLDSISVENLTKQTSFGFGELPERDDYRINLTQNKYWGSTSVHDLAYDNSIYMLENKPGLVSVGYSGHTSTNASITLYNINGQKLLAKNNLKLDNGSLIEVEINHAGIYLLYINTPRETKTFKAIGASKSGQLAIALQNNSATPLKNGQLYHVDDHTQTGDNIKIRVFKNNYVAAPIEITVEKDTSLVFALDSVTAPTVQTLDASDILSNSATLNGNILNDGHSPITECGFYWSATIENPGEADSIIIVEGTTGSFSTELSGLEHVTTYYVKAYTTNEIGTSHGETLSFTTNTALASVTTSNISNITQTTAIGGGNIISDGGSTITARGVCWNTTGNPTTDDSTTTDGADAGSWVSELVELQPNTTYYVRAYATNSQGTAYGEQNSFTTLEHIFICDALDNCNFTFTQGGNAEWVTQTEESYYAGSSAQSGIIDDNQQSTLETTVTGPGIVSFHWKVSSESGYDKLKFYIESTLEDEISGTVDWELQEVEIPEGTHTIEWSYTKDSSVRRGQDHGWLDKVVFTTVEATLPTVTTASTSNITQTTAVSGGEVTSSGNAAITARGVCWNTTGNPTIADSKTSNGTGTESWVSELVELQANTTYYMRAYATNSEGTSYGDVVQFTTSSSSGGDTGCKDTQTAVVDITNPATGKIWMDRNLGASRAATSSTDSEAYGDLYQWGRAADGHQKRNSPVTSILSNSNTPGHNNFITMIYFPADWRSPQNTDLWQGVSGINNPCPIGYRLPTDAEWITEYISWRSDVFGDGTINSPIKLPLAGYRCFNDGSIILNHNELGQVGYYWSSTIENEFSQHLFLYSSGTYTSLDNRGRGYSVRCIKD
jgi:uncharacterized protein (TIGR02145 family)